VSAHHPSTKAKTTGSGQWTEDIGIPTFITQSRFFGKSQLADLLFIAPGTSESKIRVNADPLAVSTESMSHLVSEVTREWLEENLAPSGEIRPEEYLFDEPLSEVVPVAWLERIFSLPVHDDKSFVMDDDTDR
jgi:hypothetical protein